MSAMYNYTNPTDMSTWTKNDQTKWIAFLDQVGSADEIILIIFAICIIVGNVLVLVATGKEASLHQPNKYFIACLAVADLLVGMIVCPIRVYYRYLESESLLSTMSIHLCRFMAWTDTFALAASIFTLTFISIDRFIKIKKPLQYKSRMTTSKLLKIIFIIWLVSTAFATYAAIPDSGSSYGPVCSTIDFDKKKGYYTFLAVSTFLVPTTIILLMYALIFIVAHKRQKMLRNGEIGQTYTDRNQRSAFLQSLKTIRMLAFVAGVFILCWGPFFILYSLRFYYPNFIDSDSTSFKYKRRIRIAKLVTDILRYSNSLCNPIIYAWLDQTYRVAFKNLFQQMICRPSSKRRQLPEAIELHPLRR